MVANERSAIMEMLLTNSEVNHVQRVLLFAAFFKTYVRLLCACSVTSVIIYRTTLENAQKG